MTLPIHLPAGEIPVYIGTYTQSGSKGIHLTQLDTATGSLSAPETAAEATDPEYLAVSPSGKILYAVTDGGKEGLVRSYRIQPDCGLAEIASTSLDGNSACYVSVDQADRHVLTASYGRGTASVFLTSPDGRIGPRTDLVKFEGSGPHPYRQKAPYGHCIVAAGPFVYVCDLGTDSVWSFRLDNGRLDPLEPPAAKVPPGGGPRHLVFHPNADFAYVDNEMGLSVTAFQRDPSSGALTPIQTVSTIPEGGASSERWKLSAIAPHPSGKWLYVSSRGDDTIAIFEIQADGKLRLLEKAPAEVKTPRAFGIDPSGKWLIAAGQDDGRLVTLEIDPETGQLTPSGHSIEVGSPVCVVFPPAQL